MSPKDLRLFIAIELSEEIKQALAALQESLRSQLPPKVVRWTRPGGIHLTLKFLGDTAEERVDVVAQAMQQAAAGFPPFQIQVAGFGCFPSPRRARVLWVGIPNVPKELAGLQWATDLHMSRLGWEREKRPFSPHLTLGRVNKKVSNADRQSLSDLLARSEIGHLGTMTVSQIVLFKSDLRPSGPVYTALARAPLTGLAGR